VADYLDRLLNLHRLGSLIDSLTIRARYHAHETTFLSATEDREGRTASAAATLAQTKDTAEASNQS
jgi:hypothetical protein